MVLDNVSFMNNATLCSNSRCWHRAHPFSPSNSTHCSRRIPPQTQASNLATSMGRPCSAVCFCTRCSTSCRIVMFRLARWQASLGKSAPSPLRVLTTHARAAFAQYAFRKASVFGLSDDFLTITFALSCHTSRRYALLPMVGLSAVGIVFALRSTIGGALALVCTSWCALAASKMFAMGLGMHDQRWLVAYPCLLLYGVFAMLSIF